MPCLLEALLPYDLLCPSVGQAFGWLVGVTYVHTHGPIGSLVTLFRDCWRIYGVGCDKYPRNGPSGRAELYKKVAD